MSSLIQSMKLRSLLLCAALVLQACATAPDEPSDVLVLEDGSLFFGDAADKGEVQQRLLTQFRQWRGTPYQLGGNSKLSDGGCDDALLTENRVPITRSIHTCHLNLTVKTICPNS